MADGDLFVLEVARKALLSSLTDPQAILYRQQALADCLRAPAAVREIYALAVHAVEARPPSYLSRWSSPSTIMHTSLQAHAFYAQRLKELRRIADECAEKFSSEPFVRFFAMLKRELDDDYLHTIDGHAKALRFREGLRISAGLGPGNRASSYVLHEPAPRPSWFKRIAERTGSGYWFRVGEDDTAGARALDELRGAGLNEVASTLAQSADHIESFFTRLRAELAFYVGCLNLEEKLAKKGEPICLPVPSPIGRPELEARGLYDVSLTLHVDGRVVGNDVVGDGKALGVITGANQGGKSTFLRSLGQAQLMMQCGMFVAAEAFRADVREGIFTHYKREEDESLESGKLDDELRRMSRIVEAIDPHSLLLCNESFASTNEREGSEIGRQVIRPLLETGVKVFLVTHLFDLADSLLREDWQAGLFLRAERRADGARTFRMMEGEPLSTSHGQDLYERIFDSERDGRRAGLILR